MPCHAHWCLSLTFRSVHQANMAEVAKDKNKNYLKIFLCAYNCGATSIHRHLDKSHKRRVFYAQWMSIIKRACVLPAANVLRQNFDICVSILGVFGTMQCRRSRSGVFVKWLWSEKLPFVAGLSRMWHFVPVSVNANLKFKCVRLQTIVQVQSKLEMTMGTRVPKYPTRIMESVPICDYTIPDIKLLPVKYLAFYNYPLITQYQICTR